MTQNLFLAILTGDQQQLARIATNCRNIAGSQPKRSLGEFYLSMARTAEKALFINNSHKIFEALKSFNHA